MDINRHVGQVCVPATYDLHDSPEHFMTHEVEGGAPEQFMARMTQEVRGRSRKGGSLSSYNSQGLPENMTFKAKEALLKQYNVHS